MANNESQLRVTSVVAAVLKIILRSANDKTEMITQNNQKIRDQTFLPSALAANPNTAATNAALFAG